MYRNAIVAVHVVVHGVIVIGFRLNGRAPVVLVQSRGPRARGSLLNFSKFLLRPGWSDPRSARVVSASQIYYRMNQKNGFLGARSRNTISGKSLSYVFVPETRPPETFEMQTTPLGINRLTNQPTSQQTHRLAKLGGSNRQGLEVLEVLSGLYAGREGCLVVFLPS